MYANIYSGLTEQQALYLADEALAPHEPYVHFTRDLTDWDAGVQLEMEEDNDGRS